MSVWVPCPNPLKISISPRDIATPETRTRSASTCWYIRVSSFKSTKFRPRCLATSALPVPCIPTASLKLMERTAASRGVWVSIIELARRCSSMAAIVGATRAVGLIRRLGSFLARMRASMHSGRRKSTPLNLARSQAGRIGVCTVVRTWRSTRAGTTKSKYSTTSLSASPRRRQRRMRQRPRSLDLKSKAKFGPPNRLA